AAVHRDLIVAAAARHKLPAVYVSRFMAAGGGLISYGPDFVEQYRLAAPYVDPILKGEKPGDLPGQAPDNYQLVINIKTAKALGLDVPPTLLARAEEVIECPVAYRATTMFVHLRETPYGLAMSLVENRRENGRICHEHVANLGSIETPPSVAARIEFWRGL